jgi:gamma-glutamylcyclotransferase (GGCT)/AIG2-like uncharacterized protein YtfP
VLGEIYRVPKTGLTDLDRLENHPWWYRRQKINAKVLKMHDQRGVQQAYAEDDKIVASIYIFECEEDITKMRQSPEDYLDVIDGDWKKCLAENTVGRV